MEPRPGQLIVIVTGANSGVGFGICHRLLVQLSDPNPSDATLRDFGLSQADTPQPQYQPVTGLTLILACRNKSRAETARAKLWELFQEHLEQARLQWGEEYYEYATAFRRNVNIDFVCCDLGRTDRIFDFCDEISKRYPYITHLVLNAGIISYKGMDWSIAILQLLTDYKGALTAPAYKLQHIGETNEEGLGWTWLCNVFGHYIITRELEDLLRRSPSQPARILWVSSLEGRPDCFDLDDWQCTKSSRSYEGSKYQMDLLAMSSNLLLAAKPQETNPRHIIVHPSVTYSELVVGKMFFATIFYYVTLFTFGLARIFGSQFHPIWPFKGAISATYSALSPISALPPPSEPVKIGSRATCWGNTYVELDPIHEFEKRKAQGLKLLAKYDALYESLRRKREVEHATPS
ncbi:hypothetical protein FRB99_001824 [Tulasnella sp. 403]|nr:hypothetical protein FRB99_001824 [Tulasnella sp. 403]